MAEWKQKQDPYVCCLQETKFRSKDTHRWKWGDGKSYSMQMEMKRKPGSNNYIRQNDFKIKTVTRYNEGWYIIVKGSIQEDITIEKIYMHPTQEHLNT